MCLEHPDSGEYHRFVSDVGYSFNEIGHADAESFDINEFTIQRVLQAPRPRVVEEAILRWLKDHVGEQLFRKDDPDLIEAVGWNVATFDVARTVRTFPRLKRFFSHRAVELNSVARTIAKAHGVGKDVVKEAAKRSADGTIGLAAGKTGDIPIAGAPLGKGRHDAGYDSLAVMYEWGYMCDVVRDGVTAEMSVAWARLAESIAKEKESDDSTTQS